MNSGPTTSDRDAHNAQRTTLDADIAALGNGARAWSRLTLGQRARLLERVHATVAANAEEWADTAALSKQLGPGHPLRGEEWLMGPYAALDSLAAYRDTLDAMDAGRNPLDGVKTDAAPGGRLRAHTFPLRAIDRLLLSGFTGEVWFEPGVTEAEARRGAGLAQRNPGEMGGVGLVLGAGNVTALPVLDTFYELLAHNRTVLLKVNPTQDALVPVLQRALAPLIEPGYLRIVRGGPDVGEQLTAHPGIDHVHITGAATTFEAIAPHLTKPITAELGGVSPIIVVPGRWTAADLRYHAEHIATMRLYNSGHNCIAAQVVILSSDWPQREAFLAALRDAYARAPQRPVWYPRADEKLEAAASVYPHAWRSADGTRLLVEVGAGDDATAIETTEYFAPVLGVVELPSNGQEFLDAAVAHANEKLAGTLGANVLIDPVTQAALGDGFERAIADLRYGAIAINSWTGYVFLTPNLTWGGFPGATMDDVESGIGVVHNARLLDRVERSVSRGPFRPFPRSIGALWGPGRFSILPKPPWFVSSRTGATVSEEFTRFRMHGRLSTLVGAFLKALRS